jgi:hypothetical protein
MKAHAIYYLLLSIIFMIEFAVNLSFYITYKEDVCVS